MRNFLLIFSILFCFSHLPAQKGKPHNQRLGDNLVYGKGKLTKQKGQDRPLGDWKYYYDEDGSEKRLAMEGTYQEGFKVGEWKAYYPGGELLYTKTYLSDALELIAEDPRGFSDQGAEGPYIAYYKNGNILEKGNYTNGSKDGAWTQYHENGNRKQVEVYQDGKVNAPVKYFGEDGILVSSVDFTRGFPAPVTKYHKSGAILAQFKLDKYELPVGDYVSFYENGQVMQKASYSYDARGRLMHSGDWTHYTPNGEVFQLVRWEDGYPQIVQLPSDKMLEETGNSIPFKIEIRFANDDFAITGECMGGKRSGTWRYYYLKTSQFQPNTQMLASEGNYLNGLETGEWKYYPMPSTAEWKDEWKSWKNSKGSSYIASASYTEGILNGPWYYEDQGGKSMGGVYNMGKMTGDWFIHAQRLKHQFKYLEDDGAFSSEVFYLKDEQFSKVFTGKWIKDPESKEGKLKLTGTFFGKLHIGDGPAYFDGDTIKISRKDKEDLEVRRGYAHGYMRAPWPEPLYTTPESKSFSIFMGITYFD